MKKKKKYTNDIPNSLWMQKELQDLNRMSARATIWMGISFGLALFGFIAVIVILIIK